MRSCEVSRKLVGSWKLEIGVNKGDVKEIKKGDLEKKKKNIVKHERGIMIILTLNLSISINYSFNL